VSTDVTVRCPREGGSGPGAASALASTPPRARRNTYRLLVACVEASQRPQAQRRDDKKC
jgi:hypothetical protein